MTALIIIALFVIFVVVMIAAGVALSGFVLSLMFVIFIIMTFGHF